MVVACANAQTPSLDWGYGFGSTGHDESHTVAVDSLGNYYLCGSFWGTVDFDPSEQGVHELTSFGLWDIFVLKLDTVGSFQDVWQIGGPNPDGVSNPPFSGGFSQRTLMNIDAEGNVYLVLYAGDNMDVDPSVGVQNIGSAQDNLVIMKLDSSGNLLWHHVFPEQSYALSALDATLGPEGDLYYLCGCQDGQDLDPSPTGSFIVNAASTGNGRARCIIKYNADGEFLWAGLLPPRPSSLEMGQPISTSDRAVLGVFPNGDVVVAGFFHGTKSFVFPSDTVDLTAVGGADVFVLRVGPSGEIIWNEHLVGLDSTAHCATASVTVSIAGDVYLAGIMFNGSIDFNPGDDDFILARNGGYLLKLGSEGSFRWLLDHGESWAPLYRSVALDVNQDPWITGAFGASLGTPTGTDTIVLESNSGWGTMVIHADSSGFYEWAGGFNIGLTNTEMSYSAHWNIKGDMAGGVIVSGSHRDTIDVGLGPIQYHLTSSSNKNAYLLRIENPLVVDVPEERSESLGLLVYPNPARETVRVVLKDGTTNARLEVKDVLGRSMQSLTYGQGKNWALDVSDWPTGVYLLQCTDTDGNALVQKVVKE